MSKKEQENAAVEKEQESATVNSILEGLAGDLKVGKKYYVFTVSYHYIGVVEKVTPWAIYLKGMIVSRAGSESNAVQMILDGKKKPEVSEDISGPIGVAKQAITAFAEFV